MNIETIREFIGWCLVINVSLMLLSTVLLVLLRGWVSKIHSKMFGLDEASVRKAYFRYLANYKIALIILNLVPYIALCVMTSS